MGTASLVDNGHVVVFNKDTCTVHAPECVHLLGPPLATAARDTTDGLWYFNNDVNTAHMAYQYGMTFNHVRDYVAFFHRVMGSPTIDTLNTAVRLGIIALIVTIGCMAATIVTFILCIELSSCLDSFSN